MDVVEVLSGAVLTGGQSMGVCCGESSSFFVSSNLVSLVDGSTASALVRCGASSFTSIDSVGCVGVGLGFVCGVLRVDRFR